MDGRGSKGQLSPQLYRIRAVRAEEPRPLARIGIVVLALAVVFCLVLPMTGGNVMHAALVCCFVLAILLSVAILIGPARKAALGLVLGQRHPRPAGVLAVARAPNPIALGALLI